MMEELPIDMSNPAVRDYLFLIRLQVLTPLSLLINIAAVMICTIVVTPSIRDIEKMYPSSISPNPMLIAPYVLLIYFGQVGYCVLLLFARKSETKQTAVKGVGFGLVLANWVMAFWAISWVMQWFIASTVLLGILTVILIYCNVVLLVYHKPNLSKRPLDVVLIHAPLRLFLILPMSLMFPYSLFINLGHTWSHGDQTHYTRGQWPGFGVMLGVNLIGFVVIVIRRDIVWTIGAVWVCAAVWSQKPKPASVYILTIIFTVLHPLGLIVSYVWGAFDKKRKQGRIRLPEDEGELARNGDAERETRPPREVDTDALWG